MHYKRTFTLNKEVLTQGYFKDFMLNLLSNPINCTLKAATTHAYAMQ